MTNNSPNITDITSSTRGSKYKLQNHSFHYNFRKFSFTARVVDVWNSLFKIRLDKFWDNQNVMFDWTADIRALILYRRRRFINHLLTYLLTYITGTGDRSEYKLAIFREILFKVDIIKDTVTEALVSVPATVFLLC